MSMLFPDTRPQAEGVGEMILVVDAFDRLYIPYLIGGSMASALHGVTRSTIDADVVTEIEPEQPQSLAEMLRDDFYADEDWAAELNVADLLRKAVEESD